MKRAYIVAAALVLAGCATTDTTHTGGPAACIPSAPVVAIRPARPVLAVSALPATATTAEQQEALVVSLRQCTGYAFALEKLTTDTNK